MISTPEGGRFGFIDPVSHIDAFRGVSNEEIIMVGGREDWRSVSPNKSLEMTDSSSEIECWSAQREENWRELAWILRILLHVAYLSWRAIGKVESESSEYSICIQWEINFLHVLTQRAHNPPKGKLKAAIQMISLTPLDEPHPDFLCSTRKEIDNVLEVKDWKWTNFGISSFDKKQRMDSYLQNETKFSIFESENNQVKEWSRSFLLTICFYK